MRVLITDSFSSANRGDAAILDAMIAGLTLEGAEVEVVSHFPEVARHFHGIDAVFDGDVRAVALAIARADLVVSCGGSFLHDLYAPNLNGRLATLHAARRIGVPYVIFGQSIGPFVAPMSRQAAREVLDGAAWICVRDEASARVVRELGVGAPMRVGVDAAVLGRSLPAASAGGPVLGVTVRSWHFPGLDDAEARQSAYEYGVAQACDAWVEATGGSVRFFSNCTSFGGYRQDDRVAARRVAARMQADAEVVESVDMDFASLRGECGACDLFLGTRMHSLIFATTACVPAVGIAYEQKTVEWMRQMGLPDNAVDITNVRGLTEKILETWRDRVRVGDVLSRHVDGLIATAREDMAQLVAVADGRIPARPQAERRDAAGWDGETWRYDLAHRRLRVVADIVMGEGGSRVLDLGCSTGMLGRMIGPAYDYTGVDVAASVAADEDRFRIRTGTLDEYVPSQTFDVVVASGSLEYVDDLEGVLAAIRGSLNAGGLAVVTLFNLAHFSRALGQAPRHPAWTLQARPDDFVLALHEAGLIPQRIVASTAGYGGAPAVHDERPTDCEIDGLGQFPPERMLRLAHHWVFVCRAGEAQAGPARLSAEIEAGHLPDALRIAVDLVRHYPWSARAWSDLACAWHAAGKVERAAEAMLRAFRLDPTRPDVAENVEALGLTLDGLDPETALLANPDDPAAWARLVGTLQSLGQVASARTVAGLRRIRGCVAAK